MEDSGIQSGDFANLNPQDADLFDRLVDVEFNIDDLKGVDDQMRERARKLLGMMGLLDEYPVEAVSAEDRETLISATMLRIDREMDDQAERMKLDPVARLPRLRLREFVAVAAVLERTLGGLSSGLPRDVTVSEVSVAPDGFHARDSCIGKRYVYTVHEGGGDPFCNRYRWVLGRGKALDVGAMRAAAAG